MYLIPWWWWSSYLVISYSLNCQWIQNVNICFSMGFCQIQHRAPTKITISNFESSNNKYQINETKKKILNKQDEEESKTHIQIKREEKKMKRTNSLKKQQNKIAIQQFTYTNIVELNLKWCFIQYAFKLMVVALLFSVENCYIFSISEFRIRIKHNYSILIYTYTEDPTINNGYKLKYTYNTHEKYFTT